MKAGLAGTIYGQNATSFLLILLNLAEKYLDAGESVFLSPFRQLLLKQMTLKEEHHGINTQTISTID